MTRIPLSKGIINLLGVCRAWAIDSKNIELWEFRSRIEQLMKRPWENDEKIFVMG